jgi:hypothetical protein
VDHHIVDAVVDFDWDPLASFIRLYQGPVGFFRQSFQVCGKDALAFEDFLHVLFT